MPIRLVELLNPPLLLNKMAQGHNLQRPTVVQVEVCECSILGL
jgi:hypothetical protein